MIDLEQTPALYRQALDEYDRALGGDGQPDPFAAVRARARSQFEVLGLPTRRDEAWKYTDLRSALAPDYAFASAPAPLAAADLTAHTIAGLDAARVVVVDGHVQAHLSDFSGLPDGVTVGSLAEAARAEGSTVADFFGRYASVDRDAFAALNTQFRLDGLFLHIPRGVVVERPVHVMHLVTATRPTFVQSRHLVVVGENAQATVVETFAHVGDRGTATFRNDLTEIVVGRAGHLHHVRIQNEGDAAHGVSLVQVYQEAGSTAETLTFTFASGTVRNNTAMVPDGEGCQSTLGGLYLCHGTQHVDTSTLVDHVAPGCQSNELFKGVVYDRSVGVFNGKVFVRREAQQTNAYQQSQGVVLSPTAKHYSKPELEIYADDVKCSHGSTTGAIVPEHIFYLRSRGVSERDARAMLLYAFAHDVVEMVRPLALRDHLDALIADRLT